MALGPYSGGSMSYGVTNKVYNYASHLDGGSMRYTPTVQLLNGSMKMSAGVYNPAPQTAQTSFAATTFAQLTETGVTSAPRVASVAAAPLTSAAPISSSATPRNIVSSAIPQTFGGSIQMSSAAPLTSTVPVGLSVPQTAGGSIQMSV